VNGDEVGKELAERPVLRLSEPQVVDGRTQTLGDVRERGHDLARRGARRSILDGAARARERVAEVLQRLVVEGAHQAPALRPANVAHALLDVGALSATTTTFATLCMKVTSSLEKRRIRMLKAASTPNCFCRP
jgi:hypothetical protein